MYDSVDTPIMDDAVVWAGFAGVIAASGLVGTFAWLGRRKHVSPVRTEPAPAPASPPTSDTPVAPHHAPAPAGTLTGVRVLIVDDDEAVQRLVGELLIHAGAVPTFADNGRKALAIFQSWTPDLPPRFDLILMDMDMPLMNGLEATRLLREQGVPTPVIALTVDDQPGVRERCLKAGCVDYAHKSMSHAALAALCQRWARPAPVAVAA